MFAGHGDDAHRFKKIRFNFSSNVWHQGAPLPLRAHLKKNISAIAHYPPPRDDALLQKIANHHNLPKQNFFLSSGSVEAVYAIAQLFANSRALILEPTFAEYRDACHRYNIDALPFLLPLPSDLCESEIKNKLPSVLKEKKISLVFFCNPNNPTGSYVSVQEFLCIVKKFPSTYFVIDEAYFDFCFHPQKKTFLAFIKESKNLIVLKSLTKNFSLSGLRLGYLVANKSICAQLTERQLPWSINSLALLAAHWIFDNRYPLPFDEQQIKTETHEFSRRLEKIPQVTCAPSLTHYFLVRLHNPLSNELKIYLANQHAILIRDACNFYMLDKHFIRLSLQNITAQTTLITGIKKFFRQEGNNLSR